MLPVSRQRSLKRTVLLSSEPVHPSALALSARAVPSVPMPETNELKLEMLYGVTSKTPTISLLRAHLSREGRVAHDAALRIVREARAILEKEANLLQLAAPITAVGDIHGQFYDLMQIFDLAGLPSPTNKFLFLGDYVDRGAFSTEVVLFLLALKINYPDCIYLLRGNHESRRLSAFMSFGPECKKKYGEEIFNEMQELFCALPLAAVVSNTSFGNCFCVHAGIGPGFVDVNDINKIDRFIEIPDEGVLTDLTWSDPDKEWNPWARECAGWTRERWATRAFSRNTYRDISFFYGAPVVRRFLDHNSMACIIRGHEAEDDGYKRHFASDGDVGVPPVLTLFSCPNYCDQYGNRGAYLKIEEAGVHIYQINNAPHPATLPNFVDAFSFSIPAITETVIIVLKALVSSVMSGKDVATPEEQSADERLAQRTKQLWARSQRVREQQEEFRRVLLKDYHEKMPEFERMLILDRENESVPKLSLSQQFAGSRGRAFMKQSI